MNTQLKKARQTAGLTQVDIARKAQMSEVGYQRYESGERVPNVYTAILIAHILNSTVEELFGAATPIDEKPGGNKANTNKHTQV